MNKNILVSEVPGGGGARWAYPSPRNTETEQHRITAKTHNGIKKPKTLKTHVKRNVQNKKFYETSRQRQPSRVHHMNSPHPLLRNVRETVRT